MLSNCTKNCNRFKSGVMALGGDGKAAPEASEQPYFR
jgi:hypothetical protein